MKKNKQGSDKDLIRQIENMCRNGKIDYQDLMHICQDLLHEEIIRQSIKIDKLLEEHKYQLLLKSRNKFVRINIKGKISQISLN